MAETGNATVDRAALTDEERIDWLRLIRSEHIGPRTFKSLLRYCGSARAALAQLPELARRGGSATVRICSRAEPDIQRSARSGQG
jgi:DNA processing protein